MLEVWEDDDLVLIPLKNVAPTIPKRESEMRKLIEDSLGWDARVFL